MFIWTAGDQLASEDGPWASDTVTNTYNNRFRSALSLQQPSGTWTNGFGYDELARVTNVISPAGASAYQYRDITLPSGDHTACELVARLNLPNTSYITNNHDGLGRLLSTVLKSSGDVTLNSHDYLYNNGSQRTRQTFTDSSSDYTYDNIGQLTIADSTVNTEDRGYFYDAAWNLNFRTNNGALKTFQVDNKNQLTNAPSFAPGNATLTYDANGNLFSKTVYNWWYDYDDENRLVNWYYYSTGQDGLGSPTDNSDLKTHLVYDGLGRLRTRDEYGVSSLPPFTWVLVSETRYIYDGNRVIQERDGNNTPTVSYTRGNDLSGGLEGAGGIGGLLARSHGYSGGTWSTHNFYQADGNGNVTYMVNSSQSSVAAYKYDPFGNLISSSGTLAGANVYRFSSKEQHANSGMYYYGFRFYDPNLQRWINRDPIGESGGFNLYAFVSNDPTDLLDALGLDDGGKCGRKRDLDDHLPLEKPMKEKPPMQRSDYQPKGKDAGQGADKLESLQDMEKAHADDPEGARSIEKAKQKAKAQLDELKKQAEQELARKAVEEAMRKANQNQNMLDTGLFNTRNMLDLLKNPMKAMDGCSQNWLW